MSLAQVEAELIRQTLVHVTSNRAEAARKLGVSRRALQYKIKRYGLALTAPRHSTLAKHAALDAKGAARPEEREQHEPATPLN
jgi:hypothetical protein